MALASGAHVKIGTYEYNLDEEAGEHYRHDFELPDFGPQGIEGQEGKAALSGRLLWGFDDWSGGEGNRPYFKDEPTKYHYAETLSPRKRGILTGRPSRTVVNKLTIDERQKALFRVAEGVLWLVSGKSESGTANSFLANWTNDGTTWSSSFDIAPTDRNTHPTAAAGDTSGLYIAKLGNEDVNYGRRIMRIQRNGTLDSITAFENAEPPFAGMAALGGLIYCWTGSQLYSFNTTDAYPAALTLLSPAAFPALPQTGLDVLWWAGCVAAENSIITFVTKDAQSWLYEYHLERGFSPLWKAPEGFSVKEIAYQNGVIYAVGSWGAYAASGIQGQAAIYEVDLDSRQASSVAIVRQDVIGNLQLQQVAPSYGNQIVVASGDTGRMWVFDADLRALSMLDDLDTSRFGTSSNKTDGLNFTSGTQSICGLQTFGGKRYSVIRRIKKNLHPVPLMSDFEGTYDSQLLQLDNCTGSFSSAVTAQSGTKFLQMSCGAGDNRVWFSAEKAPVFPNTQYTASAYFRTAVTARSCRVLLKWYDVTNTLLSTTTGGSITDATGSWTRATVTATTPDGAVAVVMVVEVLAAAAAEVHRVDAVQLEIGGSATSYETFSGNVTLVAHSDDELTNRQASTSTGNLAMSEYSPEHDFGLPYDGKLFHGVHVTWDVEDAATTSGLKTGQSIEVYGTFDGAAEVTIGTITSSTTPSTGIKGRHFIQYLPGGTTLKFFKMKTRTVLKGTRTASIDYQPPNLWSMFCEASPANFKETWTLVVRVKDELPGERPSTRKFRAPTLRTYLEDLKQTGTAVTLTDGFRVQAGDTPTTHTVTVEKISDVIERNAEGRMQVVLKAVTN